ncbi:gamma-taxilin-like [Protopterus annectens]|uniref:gamma-taxilin-like n=1 Tax=Protopterus annectens TaxID=7888 RepID=UPI001CFABAF6|nr:gamma-taxilin-like [Protopterus annectens]
MATQVRDSVGAASLNLHIGSTEQQFENAVMEATDVCGMGRSSAARDCIEPDSLFQDSDCNLIGDAVAQDDEHCGAANKVLEDTICCAKECRGETPGREDTRIDPPDGEQDATIEKNKEKTLGKEVLLLMQALNTLSTPEEKLAALCKKYADLVRVYLKR